MKPPLRPTDEARRLEALRQYNLLDTLPEQALDDLILTGGTHLRSADLPHFAD
ncbi:MAG TPA: hypothetical protein VNT99_03345 [Methylomirabilota bacterium]|nr:hypothetical protein [Methylomirabilota bacterium]